MTHITKKELLIPSSIIIAGILIAIALFFGLSKGSFSENSQPSQQKPSAPQVGKVKPVDLETDHIRGSKDAKVFLIEYSDFECPFCKRFDPTIKEVIAKYDGKVAWVYRHFPLSFHANAQKEAEATECAAELGGNDMFWKYADAITERTKSNGVGFSLTSLVPLAKELGLDSEDFKTCLDTGKYAQKVKDQMKEGQTAGVTGTPGTIVWTKTDKPQIVSGAVPASVLMDAIDKVLK